MVKLHIDLGDIERIREGCGCFEAYRRKKNAEVRRSIIVLGVNEREDDDENDIEGDKQGGSI